MTDEKMIEVIKSESDQSMFFIAIMKFIKLRIEDELGIALGGDQADSQRAFNNGRAAAMIDLVGLIDEVRS